jgi:catalase
MSAITANYVRYEPSVEMKQDHEEKTFAEINALIYRAQVLLNDRYRHAVRFVHSKSHGILKAELTVNADLPEELRQGLFSAAGKYPAIIRFSTAPGDIMADSVSTPRGMAVKVVGVQGMEMLPEHAGHATQDFVFLNSKTFGVSDAKAFLKNLKLIELTLNEPELVKKTVSNLARGINAFLGVIGAHSGTLDQFGSPETHVLGETYASNAAIRYGDFIAKVCFKPLSENLKALTGKHVSVNFHYSGLRDAVVDFFKTQTAVWEVGVQLCTDTAKMPVEDPSKTWPEDISPYRAVGTLTAGPQDAYSPARRVYADEVLAFSPWHALAAHRPLGNIMRARRASYGPSAEFRQSMNGYTAAEPKDISEFPD